MAEEFKACLISLGYDVENDKQVGAPRERGTAFGRCTSRRTTLGSLQFQFILSQHPIGKSFQIIKLSEFCACLAKIQLVKLH